MTNVAIKVLTGFKRVLSISRKLCSSNFVACIVPRSLIALACALFYVTKISILKSNTLIIIDRLCGTVGAIM